MIGRNKVAFADRDLPFDRGYVTKEFGLGTNRGFCKVAGERDLIVAGYYGREPGAKY